MGTDIHFHAEIKVDGQWHHYNELNIDCNNKLFGWLAGVEVPDLQEIKLRGIPDDVSLVTSLHIDYWKKKSFYNPSWISIKEFTEMMYIFRLPFKQTGYFFCCNSYSSFFYYRENYPEKIEDVRFVFWFDS